MTQVTLPLSRVPVGERRTITSVSGPARAELEREGLLPGSVVRVAGRTPLGGPVIVEVGRVRVAVSADVAASVETVPAAGPGAGPTPAAGAGPAPTAGAA
jgi:Fe2+ transport system protein FeoA